MYYQQVDVDKTINRAPDEMYFKMMANFMTLCALVTLGDLRKLSHIFTMSCERLQKGITGNADLFATIINLVSGLLDVYE